MQAVNTMKVHENQTDFGPELPIEPKHTSPPETRGTKHLDLPVEYSQVNLHITSRIPGLRGRGCSRN
jgi:hypothetical protein